MRVQEDKKIEKARFEEEKKAGNKLKDQKDKQYKTYEANMTKEQEKEGQLDLHVKELKADLKIKKALLRKCEKEYGPLSSHRHRVEADIGGLKVTLALTNKEYDDLRAEVDESKKRIEAKMRERDLLNKDVVLAEEKEREKGDAI